MQLVENVNFENLGAVAAVCALLLFVVKWLLGSFVERLKAIEVAVTEVNDAVNNRHEKRGPDAQKLYDLVYEAHDRGVRVEEKVAELVEWKASYKGGPLDCGEKVLEYVGDTQKKLISIDDKLEHVIAAAACISGPCPKLKEQADHGPT